VLWGVAGGCGDLLQQELQVDHLDVHLVGGAAGGALRVPVGRICSSFLWDLVLLLVSGCRASFASFSSIVGHVSSP
jgi:hypothetical protein